MDSNLHDSYCMNSSGVIDIYTNEQVITSINLEVTPELPSLLSGYVWDRPAQGKGVGVAEVSLFTQSNEFLQRTYSDNAGYFAFYNLESGAYKLTASKEGYQTARFINLLLEPGNAVLQNLVLLPLDSSENLIYGRVTNAGQDPVPDARVDVIGNNGQKIAGTVTAIDGTYAVYGMPDGAYTLIIGSDGHESLRQETQIGAQSRMQNLDAALMPANIPPDAASICGFITNKQGYALACAWVGLYAVSGQREEKLAATAFTTADGFYSFSPLPAGKYLVKSKMMVV